MVGVVLGVLGRGIAGLLRGVGRVLRREVAGRVRRVLGVILGILGRGIASLLRRVFGVLGRNIAGLLGRVLRVLRILRRDITSRVRRIVRLDIIGT